MRSFDGHLVARQSGRSRRRRAPVQLSTQRFRAPGSKIMRTYAVPTLERWSYRLRKQRLVGLKPILRRDLGRARALSNAQKDLILDIRREYPKASVPDPSHVGCFANTI